MIKSKAEAAFAVLAVLAAFIAVVFALSVLFLGKAGGAQYEKMLFDDKKVHTVDIKVNDWGGFIENAEQEKYVSCTVTIDGEQFERVGIRTKGNNSLRLTSDYNLCRYSLKLKFDRYDKNGSYFGLDKFSLDSCFQDNSYMKAFITFDMMRQMGVYTPLCSYAWVTVNGVDWGLFLAVEEPEEAFAKRNFGNSYGCLYKPDYKSLKEENADVALKYIDDNPKSYSGIFDNAKFPVTTDDEKRLISALKTLASGDNLETAVNIDEVLRYFTVQIFVMNWDSYIGRTGHNYFLYEENGVISMIPWDYNLAFGTYALGMTDPITDPSVIINYPVYTPASGEVMKNRPLYHNLMKNDEYFALYRKYFAKLISEYFESGYFEQRLLQTKEMIVPFVQKDPTAFCTYEDFLTATDTLKQVCLLRAQSVKGQLEGKYPATLSELEKEPYERVDTSGVDLYTLGDFDDLKNARKRQSETLKKVIEADK